MVNSLRVGTLIGLRLQKKENLMNTKAYIKKYLIEDIILLAVFGTIVFLPPEIMAQDTNTELRPKHERIINHFDKDGDGTLNDREAYHARHFYNRWKQSQGSNDRPRDIRPRFDRNNDGQIGPRERANARRIQARRNRSLNNFWFNRNQWGHLKWPLYIISRLIGTT